MFQIKVHRQGCKICYEGDFAVVDVVDVVVIINITVAVIIISGCCCRYYCY